MIPGTARRTTSKRATCFAVCRSRSAAQYVEKINAARSGIARAAEASARRRCNGTRVDFQPSACTIAARLFSVWPGRSGSCPRPATAAPEARLRVATLRLPLRCGPARASCPVVRSVRRDFCISSKAHPISRSRTSVRCHFLWQARIQLRFWISAPLAIPPLAAKVCSL